MKPSKNPLWLDLAIACVVVALVMAVTYMVPLKAHAAEPGLKPHTWGAIYHGSSFTLHLNQKPCPAAILSKTPEEWRTKGQWWGGYEVTFRDGNVFTPRETHEVCWTVDYSDATVGIYSTTGSFGWINMAKFVPDPGT